ncbi:MAG: hypothetical protein E7044_07795 [Lentisphaerae bacterium]|nr:hypothetical protein [Lentisphaerota bacterium]
MKKTLSFLLSAAAVLVSADIIKNPDANTLWKEDNKNVEKNWAYAYKGQHTRTSDGKSFSFECNTKGNTGHRDFIRVPVSKDYPWLVFRLNSVKVNPGYRTWTVRISALDRFNISQVSVQEPGYFACNVWEGANLKKIPKTAEIFFYNYTLKLTFSDLKMVKKPDNFIVVSSPAFESKKKYSPGDKIRFTVTLKEPAEDVSVRLVYPDLLSAVKLNGMGKLQLKPTDDTQKVWSAEFEVKTLGPVRRVSEFRRNTLMVRATILGGGISEPLWGTINYPFSLKK